MTDLEGIVAELEYAAGAGAARLAEGVVAQGRSDAAIAAHIARRAPGLSGLLARSGQASGEVETAVPVAEIAQHMARSLADGGAELAVGRRR